MTIGSILPFVFLSLAHASLAENWTEFRGPTKQGHATGNSFPTRWSDTQNVAWKRQLPGSGWSSPIHVDGRVYLTTADSADGPLSLRTLCLDASSGDTIWNKQVFSISDPKNIHNKNSNASPTPVFENGRLYIHFGHMGTACLNLEGDPIWTNTGLAYPPVHGNGGCPEISGDHLIFSCDGARDPFVVALDKNTGKIAWKKPRSSDAKKKFSFSTPLTIEVDGKKQLVTCGSNIVQALDPQTGEEIWHVNYTGYSVVPRPVFAHGLVYISTSFDNPVAMAIRPDGSGDVSETHVAWTAPKRAPNTPSTLVVGDEFYMVSDGGIVSCLDAKSGKIHYQERASGPVSASPLYAGGHIYIQDERGKAVVLKPGKEFKVVAENDLDEKSLASYGVGQACLFIRTESHLYRIGR
ncbi:MAG: PQQ-binding-like beta-propeller repeat protein [Verrucomicrobiales bacterium]|nr:PQQ-binding-like beta-propeller repeat protein [Verrucomicrobiales bacterium]